MKILAIRFARLGDVVLLLPALAQLKASFPNAQLTFLTGHRCAPLAGLSPAIDEVISVDRIALRDGPLPRAIWEMGKLVRNIRRRRFDLVIDFHSFRETNLLAWLSAAPKRIGMKRHNAPYLSFCFNDPPVIEDKSIHVAEMFRRVVQALGDSSTSVPRPIVIPGHIEEWARSAMPAAPRLALYVDAPVPERIWPPEYFAHVADYAIEKLGASVAVISGDSGDRLTQSVRNASRYGKQISVFTRLSVPELAGLIGSSRLFISNDTGPMHIGPALGIPTLGLFSVGYPEHFRPTGWRDRFFRANPITNIQVKEVIEAADQMWNEIVG